MQSSLGERARPVRQRCAGGDGDRGLRDPFLMDINPKDLALLELAEFDARVIASAFGVPSLRAEPADRPGVCMYQNPADAG